MIEPGQPTGLHGGAGDDLAERLWDYAALESDEDSGRNYATTGLIDLGFIGKALRRQRWLWCTLAFIGLLMGSYLLVSTKPSYGVTVSLLMAPPANTDSYTALQTDMVEVQEPAVAQIAAEKLGMADDSALLGKISPAIASNQVLSLSVSASSASLAASEGTAVAEAFLEFRSQFLTANEQAMVAAQDEQVAQAQQQIDSLRTQLSQASGTDRSTINAKLQGAIGALSALQQSIVSLRSSTQLDVTSQEAGSKILYATAPATKHSKSRYLLEYVGGGLFVGLIIGLAIVAIGAVVSDKLYRRDDLAYALGAPVPVSVTSGFTRKLPPKLPGKRNKDTDTKRVTASLRDAMASTSRRNDHSCMAIIAVDKVQYAATLVMDLAKDCARDGGRVIVADLSGGSVADLLGSKDPGVHTIDIDGNRLVLAVPDAEDIAPTGPVEIYRGQKPSVSGLAAAYSAANVLITFLTVDLAVGANHLSTWATDAVAVVTAGESSVSRIQSVGEMVRHAGTHLSRGVLVGADADDESLGLVTR